MEHQSHTCDDASFALSRLMWLRRTRGSELHNAKHSALLEEQVEQVDLSANVLTTKS